MKLKKIKYRKVFYIVSIHVKNINPLEIHGLKNMCAIIKFLRIGLRCTIEEICNELDFNIEEYTKLENGNCSDITTDDLVKLFTFYRIPMKIELIKK